MTTRSTRVLFLDDSGKPSPLDTTKAVVIGGLSIPSENVRALDRMVAGAKSRFYPGRSNPGEWKLKAKRRGLYGMVPKGRGLRVSPPPLAFQYSTHSGVGCRFGLSSARTISSGAGIALRRDRLLQFLRRGPILGVPVLRQIGRLHWCRVVLVGHGDPA